MLNSLSGKISKAWLRFFRGCLAALVIAGCATPGEIDTAQESIDPDNSAFAFSFDPGVLSEHEQSVHPGWIHVRYGTEVISVPLKRGETETQRFLMEVPEDHVDLSEIELVVGDGIVLDHYLSYLNRFRVLTRGEITYLGRMTVDDVRFEDVGDGSPGIPVAVKIVFVDAFDEDIAVLQKHYQIFQHQFPYRQIDQNWPGQDYLPMHDKVWSSSRPDLRWRRSDGPPPRPRRTDN